MPYIKKPINIPKEKASALFESGLKSTKKTETVIAMKTQAIRADKSALFFLSFREKRFIRLNCGLYIFLYANILNHNKSSTINKRSEMKKQLTKEAI